MKKWILLLFITLTTLFIGCTAAKLDAKTSEPELEIRPTDCFIFKE